VDRRADHEEDERERGQPDVERAGLSSALPSTRSPKNESAVKATAVTGGQEEVERDAVSLLAVGATAPTRGLPR
jgi:hypothetical protein